MWQRIQTLYLAIATILIGTLFFSKFATIIGPEGESVEIMYHERVQYLLFIISLFLGNAIALFSFKSRMLQMRVCILAALLLIGFQVLLAVYYFAHRNEMVFSITAVFPIVTAILDVLAARAIALDEAMVQSSSRLRSSKKRRG